MLACHRNSTVSSTLTTTLAGLEIRAVIDGPASIQSQADSAIVSTTGSKITVERERVLVDGGELAKIPATAGKLELTVTGGQLAVTADGAAIATTQLRQ